MRTGLVQSELLNETYSFAAGVAVRPILSSYLLIASLSRLSSGRERKRLIRLLSMEKASRNALFTSADVPRTEAGSGTPQCAVNGCPGHTGQISFAALSQTVIMKSSLGAPAAENSSSLAANSFSRNMRGFELTQRFEPDFSRRMTSRTVRREGWPAFEIQNRLGHDGPRLIPRAQKQNVVMSHLLFHNPTCSRLARNRIAKRKPASPLVQTRS